MPLFFNHLGPAFDVLLPYLFLVLVHQLSPELNVLPNEAQAVAIDIVDIVSLIFGPICLIEELIKSCGGGHYVCIILLHEFIKFALVPDGPFLWRLEEVGELSLLN